LPRYNNNINQVSTIGEEQTQQSKHVGGVNISSLVKISLWDLVHQLESHCEALVNALKIIKLPKDNYNSFATFMVSLQSCIKSSIESYNHEVCSHKGNDLPLYSVAYLKERSIDKVLVDEGSIINVISSIALHKLKIPLSHFNIQ